MMLAYFIYHMVIVREEITTRIKWTSNKWAKETENIMRSSKPLSTINKFTTTSSIFYLFSKLAI